ncbi:unnamed protein product, partial [Ascophyllum nodosum]
SSLSRRHAGYRMSLTLLQRKELHAAIYSYLSGGSVEPDGGGMFTEAAEVFRREAALTEEDTHLVPDGALEAKWKTKRQLEIDLMKVKDWVKVQAPCLPPLLGDEEVDDGHGTEDEDHSCTNGDGSAEGV